MDLAIVTAGDANFFDLLRGLIGSVRDKTEGKDVKFCVFDTGLTDPQKSWLTDRGVTLAVPRPPRGREVPPNTRALMARPHIPDYFPGHAMYLWMDGDTWVQEWSSVTAFCEDAREAGMAVAMERDPAYVAEDVNDIHARMAAPYGAERVARILAGTPVNAGVVAARHDSPQWKMWADRMEEKVNHEGDPGYDFYLDQSALNVAINYDKMPVKILAARNNWLCSWCMPLISPDGQTFVHPLEPHQPIGIVHQSGFTKQGWHWLPTPDGHQLSRPMRYVGPSQLRDDDYVSANLRIIMPDDGFPEMIRGDVDKVSWPYLRKEIPHAWYTDRRVLNIGFVSRDEASILYNTALRFIGQPALEIGCFMGWSAAHLALGGVILDVVDPALKNDGVRISVKNSLRAVNVMNNVTLVVGASPATVDLHARTTNRRWSLFFIDGNHDAPGPRLDAAVCEQHAADNALMLFHDLTSPDVAEGLAYLKKRGWRTRIYHTAQIMGAAWRGTATPVDHTPDPKVAWHMPEHLHGLDTD